MRHVVKPDATSPYQRYGKRPYRYSPQYYAWRRKHVSKAAEAERQHKANEERKANERKSNQV